MHGQTNRFIRDRRIARTLRTHSTDAERKLWRHLRLRQLDGWRFRRQHPLGNYVVDFVCLDRRLVVEVDGGQHVNSNADRRRDENLQRQGFRVLRFWNTEILCNVAFVLERIVDALQNTAAPPDQGPLK